MPYELGQHVRRHNRRMQMQTVAIPAAAAFSAGGSMIKGAYNMLPSFSERRIVNAAVRAAHELLAVDNDEPSNTLSTSATPTFFLLNGVQQGTAGNQRSGREVKPEGLRLALSSALNSLVSSSLQRFLVVRDNECRGAQFAIADLLQYNTQGIDQLNSPVNFDNRKRFTILLDKVYTMNSCSALGTSWGVPFVHSEFDLRLGGITHYYNTSSGTITDIDSGAIFLVCIGTSAANADSFGFSSRVTYRNI